MTRLRAPDQSTGSVPVSWLPDRSSSFRDGMLANAACTVTDWAEIARMAQLNQPVKQDGDCASTADEASSTQM